MKLFMLTGFAVLCAVAFLQSSDPVVLAEEVVGRSLPATLSVTEIPRINAKAYGVFDINTGEFIISHNLEEKLPIASVTKLFTAATVLESSQLETELVVTDDDVATEGRAGKLVSGQVYKLRELLFPLLLESSNDAGAAIERTLGKITMGDIDLADATGLSAKNQASVSELAAEVRRLYEVDPFIFDVTKLKQYIGENTGWVNNSPVRDLPGYLGGKHGYTDAAGKTLVALFSESALEGRELGYIILGSEDLNKDTITLRQAITNSVQAE